MKNFKDFQNETKMIFEKLSFPDKKNEEWKNLLVGKKNGKIKYVIDDEDELKKKKVRVGNWEVIGLNLLKDIFADFEKDKLVSYHLSNVSQPLVFIVPEKVFLKEITVNISGNEGEVFFPEIIVIAEKESVSSFKVRYWGEGMFVGSERIIVKENAKVSFVSFQDTSENSRFFLSNRSFLENSSLFKFLAVEKGSELSQLFIMCDLKGENSEALIRGTCCSFKKQKISFNTYQNHMAKKSKSDLLFKGVFDDESIGSYRGTVNVFPNMQMTNAYQANKNLLLSEKAKVSSLPILHIEANDVKCKHGVTVGKINEEWIFYLMSRGVERSRAEQIIVDGFISEAIKDFSLGEWKKEVLKYFIE